MKFHPALWILCHILCDFVQLLAPDIRHERNVLLQCVRYVVRNKFFGLESRAQNQEEPASSGSRSAALGGGSAEAGLHGQDRVLQGDPADIYDDEIWEGPGAVM